MFSWWQLFRLFYLSQLSQPSRTRCLSPWFVNTVQSPVILTVNFQNCPVFRLNSLRGVVSFVLLLKKFFYRQTCMHKVDTKSTLRSSTSGKGMGCGAQETREIVGIGGTGGTKREGGGSDRRTGTNGGMSDGATEHRTLYLLSQSGDRREPHKRCLGRRPKGA